MGKITKYPEWIFHFNKTDSTMSDAIKVISEITPAPESFIIIADEQTKGMGRNNSKWTSPKGGLWFTYCLKSCTITHQVTLLLGLCLYKTLTRHFPPLAQNLAIKWPNDILVEGRKLSGILVQAHSGYLCIGIGINTNVEQIILSDRTETASLLQLFSFQVSDSALVRSFIYCFNESYIGFTEHGISKHLEQINNHLYGINRNIDFDNGKEIIKGTCRGISEEGAILIENNDGLISPYYSGSIVSFGD